MTVPGPTSLLEILDALATVSVETGRTLRLAAGIGGMTSIEGAIDAEGRQDQRVGDLFRRAGLRGARTAEAHPDGSAALFAPRFGILGHAPADDRPVPARLVPALQGADLRLPDGAALLCLPDDMPAHQRLAEADLPARIHPGLATHGVHLWAWGARVGVVLPAGRRLILLSLARDPAQRQARQGIASLSILPRPAA